MLDINEMKAKSNNMDGFGSRVAGIQQTLAHNKNYQFYAKLSFACMLLALNRIALHWMTQVQVYSPPLYHLPLAIRIARLLLLLHPITPKRVLGVGNVVQDARARPWDLLAGGI